MMTKLIAMAPIAWGLVGALISENTGVSVGLFVGAIAATVWLVRWATRIDNRLRHIERKLGIDNRNKNEGARWH